MTYLHLLLASSLLIPSTRVDPQFDDDEIVKKALEKAGRQLEADWFRIPTSWEDAWVYQSKKHQVRTMHSFWLAKTVAKSLDDMTQHFEAFLGLKAVSGRRLPVEIHPDLAAYQNVGGSVQNDRTAHHSSAHGAFWTNELDGEPVITYELSPISLVKRFATHAAFHRHLHACNANNFPEWLEEALCAYFEMYWDTTEDRSTPHFRSLVKRGELRSWVELTQLTADQFGPNERVQLAMMVHFLQNVCESTRQVENKEGVLSPGPFQEYVQARARRAADQPLDEGLQEIGAWMADPVLEEEYRALGEPAD